MVQVDVEDQVVVPDADILVSVPCYKDGEMVERCLDSLVAPRVQLHLVDNGAAPDVKAVLAGRGILVRNPVNLYVNPAWNQAMEAFKRSGRYDLLVLANSDLVLDPGWADRLRAHRTRCPYEQIIFGVDKDRQRISLGTFFAMTARVIDACLPIPPDIRVFGGDDFIFDMARGVGFDEYVLRQLTMTHVERGTYDKSPEIWSVAREDTRRWETYVKKVIVPRRVKEFLERR